MYCLVVEAKYECEAWDRNPIYGVFRHAHDDLIIFTSEAPFKMLVSGEGIGTQVMSAREMGGGYVAPSAEGPE